MKLITMKWSKSSVSIVKLVWVIFIGFFISVLDKRETWQSAILGRYTDCKRTSWNVINYLNDNHIIAVFFRQGIKFKLDEPYFLFCHALHNYGQVKYRNNYQDDHQLSIIIYSKFLYLHQNHSTETNA